MSVLYGDDGIEHRLSDSEARLLVTDAENAPRFDRPWAPDVLVLDAGDAGRARRPTSSAPTRRPTTRPSSTTRRARPGSRRGSSTRTATSSPTRSSSTATRSRTASASTGWASGPGPPASRRCSARGGSARCSASTGARAASTRTSSSTFLSRHGVTNVFTTPTAMRSMMAIEDAGTRYPQSFRRVCSAGEPLNPEAIRWFREQYGVTVLDFYGLTESYPLVANYPVHGGARGLDGQADAGLGRADPRRGRAAGRAGRARRDLPPRALEPALPARLLAQRRGGRGDVRRRVVPHQGRRRRRTRTATTGTSAAPTT